MNFKRLLISILSLTTVASMVAPTIIETSYSHSVYAETSVSDFEYVTNTTQGYVVITGYTGSNEDIVVPETIDGYPVTTIGNNAFYNVAYSIRTSIKSIKLPNTITSIGEKAFWTCFNLTSINIPDGVTSIGSNAFANCSSLTSITIPDSVTSIGSSAFDYCKSLTSIVIPKNIKTIDGFTFSNCESLTSVTIPDSVTTIDWNAFRKCSSLKEVTIPSSITSIGYQAFKDCTNLETVTIKSKNTKINDTAFDGCYIVNIVYDYDDDITTTTPNYTDVTTTHPTGTFSSYTEATSTRPTGTFSSYTDATSTRPTGTFSSYTTTGVASNNNFVNGVYCDINGDGKVSTADLILIKKELLGL